MTDEDALRELIRTARHTERSETTCDICGTRWDDAALHALNMPGHTVTKTIACTVVYYRERT